MPIPYKVTKEMEPLFKEVFPTHTHKEINDILFARFGITIDRRCCYTTAKRLGVSKEAGHISKINAKRKEEEMRRLRYGMDQKTKQVYVLDQRLAYERRYAKFNLVRGNNYFSEKGSRDLYYDADTRRSRYKEKRYRHLFNFLPAEGFDPKDSVWIDEYNNKWRAEKVS